MLKVAIGAEGKALTLPTLGIEADQVSGDVLDPLLRTVLDPLPGSRAYGTQGYLGLLPSRAVVGELVQAMEIDVDGVIIAVDELDELLGTPLLLHRHQPIEAADTMVGMYDEVSPLEAL